MTEGAMMLITGALLALGILAALAAGRLRVPGLVLFLALGMAIGSDGLGLIDFEDFELTRTVGIIALTLILFEGGLAAGWPEIRPVVGPAISLATVGTIVTAVVVGLAAALLLDLPLLPALLLGSIVASTDSAAIFSVLRGSSLKRRVARVLEAESGLNDPIAILLVIGFIEWIQQPDFGFGDMALLFLAQLAIGAAVGLVCGRLSVLALRRGGGLGRLGVPRRLPGRPRARRRARARPGDRHRLPRGARLGEPDRAVLHARAARLPEQADRGRGRGAAARRSARGRRPAGRRAHRHARRALPRARVAADRLGGPAGRHPDRARDLPGHRRGLAG